MKPKTSAIWEFFAVVDSDTAKCNICGKKYSRKGRTTSSLKDHLKSLHADNYEELLLMEKNQKISTKNSSKTPLEESKKQVSLRDILNKKKKWDTSHYKAKEIDTLICEMIALDDLPFSFVENIGFRQLMQNIVQNFNMRGRQFFTQNICDVIYPKIAAKITAYLKKIDKLSFTTDIWSEPSANVSLISLTAHGITKEFELVKIILKCQPLYERHTGEIIGQGLKRMFHEWEIEDQKIHCCVRDGGSNMIRAMKLNNIQDVHCIVHQIQLSVRHALNKDKYTTILIAKCKTIATHFSHSLLAQSELQKIQKEQLNLEPLSVVQDCSTRWNSTFYMIERLIKIKDSICLYANKHTIPQITLDEWLYLDELVAVLQPFEEVTRNLSDSKINLSSVIPLLHVLKENLNKHVNKTKSYVVTKNLVSDLNCKFGELNSNNLFALATYLDPRYKLKFFNEIVKEQVQSHLLHLLKQLDCAKTNEINAKTCNSPIKRSSKVESSINISPSQNFQSSTVSVRSCLVNILSDSDEEEGTVTNYNENEQFLFWKALLNDYNKEKRLKWTEDPLLWWKINTKFEVLKPIVRQFLSVPPGSVPSEQLFSGAGLIYNPLRNKMHGEKAAKLLFIKYNLPILNFEY